MKFTIFGPMTRNLQARLSILQFLQYYIWGSWFVTAGTYMLNTLDFSGREVGLVYASNAVAATITPFFLGILADRYFSAEKMLSFLHIIGSVLLFTSSFLTEFRWFYPVILIYVLCYYPTFSLSNALCFHHVSDSKADFPKVRVWGTIAWIIAGIVVGGLDLELGAWPIRIAAVTSLIHGLYSLTLPSTPPQAQKTTNFLQAVFDPELKKVLSDKSLLILLISIGLICVPTSYYYSFVNPFLNEMGIHNAAGKMALGQVTEIVLMLSLPWVFTKWRLKTILFIGLFTWGARYGLFVLGIPNNLEWLYLTGLLLHGVAFVFSTLSAQIYLDTKVPTHLRSTAQGFYSFLSLGLGAFIANIVAGEFVNYYTFPNGNHNWEVIWMVPTVFGIGVSFLFWFFFRSKRKA